jgi:hypothetical protein
MKVSYMGSVQVHPARFIGITCRPTGADVL